MGYLLTRSVKYATLNVMSRTSYIIVTLIVVIASIGILWWSFGSGAASRTANKQSTATQTATTISPTNESLPFATTSQAVKTVSLIYTLVGRSVGLEPKEGGELRFIVGLKDKGNMRFFVTKDTQVVFDTNGTETPASSADLKANQKVYITASYNLKTDKWSTLTKVVIVNEN